MDIVTLAIALARSVPSKFSTEYADKVLGIGEDGKVIPVDGGGGSTNAVQYVEQSLTEAQQMQARKNLGLYYKEGEETVIEWDGDITGKPRITGGISDQTMFMDAYNVSNSVPLIETIIGAKYTLISNDIAETKTIESEDVEEIDSSAYLVTGDIMGMPDTVIAVGTAGDHLFAYPEYGIEGFYRFPEDGIYLLKASYITGDYSYVSSLVFGSETVHKIEEKYLPDESAVKYTEQTISTEQQMQARKNVGLYWSEADNVAIEWDGDTTGHAPIMVDGMELAYKVSDAILTPSELVGATLTMSDGDSIQIPPEDVRELADGFVMGGHIFSARAGNYNIGGSPVGVPEDGVYFEGYEDRYVARLEVVHETVSKIDQKFIPNSIARADDVVKCYVFDNEVDWGKLAAAATEFENGRAMIRWGEHYVIRTYEGYNSLWFIFLDNPYCHKEYTNDNSHNVVNVDSPKQYYYGDAYANRIQFMRAVVDEWAGSDLGSFMASDDHDWVNAYGKFKFESDGLIIEASDDSSKHFKITVNSAGVISATEITS